MRARRVIDSTRGSADPHKRKHAARARYILAFSAARRKDFPLARERFDDLREEASHLADKGKLDAGLGQPSYTLEEEGAYQRAICASAMGDKKTAEAELIQFMRDYPESPLIHGAVQRIERMHNGGLPEEAKKVWMQASGKSIQRRITGEGVPAVAFADTVVRRSRLRAGVRGAPRTAGSR